MNNSSQQPPDSLPLPQGYPMQAYPNGIYPLIAVYPPLSQRHIYAQGVGYYLPQGYPPPMGMGTEYPPQGYPLQIYHPPQYSAPPHEHGHPTETQKQNQATTSVIGGCLAAMCCCCLLDPCLE